MTSLVPKHVGIIMDGNRRWAINHKMPVVRGHFHGEKAIEPIIDMAIEKGISTLTFWAFSTENWHRERKEVFFLVSLLRQMLDQKFKAFHLKQVRVKFIGNISSFPADIQKKINEWTEKTESNTKITVNFALSYGGRDEIVRAIKKWYKNSKLEEQELTKEEFEKFLDTAGQPDPELIVRTGGEKRLSGFLLWQIEYAELYFTDILWPDFTPQQFLIALAEFDRRQRRFGK